MVFNDSFYPKGTFTNIIRNVIKDSSFTIKQDADPEDIDDLIGKESGVIRLITVEPGPLVIKIFSSNTYKIQGQDNKKKNLKKVIDTGISPYVQEWALNILNKGKDAWNNWRSTHGQLQIDFGGKDFHGRDLSGYEFRQINFGTTNLAGTDLTNADLNGCNLYQANLEGAILVTTNLSHVNGKEANLTRASLVETILRSSNFSGAFFDAANLTEISLGGVELDGASFHGTHFRKVNLSGAKIDEKTNFEEATGIEHGINGIYEPMTDTAALLSVSPPGNSMKGSSPEAVLETLRRGRKYLGFSFLLAVLTCLILYLELESITIPYPSKTSVSTSDFFDMSKVLAVGFLILAKSYMDDAYDGMKYLEDRKSVMRVASFPWPISRFISGGIARRAVSHLLRIALAMHPMIYLLTVDYKMISNLEAIAIPLAIAFGSWILISSQKFQQPILFDNKAGESIDLELDPSPLHRSE